MVKAKSNLTREINLTEELDSREIEVVETDIGDRILQLTNEKPSHPTGPVSHLTSYDISRYLSEYFKREVSPDSREIVKLIRGDILGYMEAAKIGITGVNAIAAEEGAILLLHNEGNILEVMLRPKKHIIVAGIDKIYPNLDEALNMAKLQTFYATGELITSFINIIGGLSKTMDIEKKLLKGVHAPKEICLILLDNKRSEIIQHGFKELLYCIGCGACLLHCPVYNFVGNKFGNENSLG
ncbi:MAG: LUD domain-containing protein [Candidatus Hydrothermarchaeales archaeon]